MRSTYAVLIAGALALGGCTSALAGHGRADPAGKSGTSRDFPSAAPSSSTSRSATPARFRRTPVSTAIGDPPAADLCSGLDDEVFAHRGFAVELADEQYPPGCDTTLDAAGGRGRVDVEAFAVARKPPPTQAHRTSRTIAGLTVLGYPYDTHDDNCERDVVARGVTIVVLTAPADGPGRAGDHATVCRAGDVVVAQVAAKTHTGFDRLALASPSVVSLDSCRIVQDAGWTTAPAADLGRLEPEAFGAGCSIGGGSLTVYIDPVLADESQVSDASVLTVGGHRLFADDDNGASSCVLTSVQGTTSDGHYEGVEVSAHDRTHPARLCSNTATDFAHYLTVAGLR